MRSKLNMKVNIDSDLTTDHLNQTLSTIDESSRAKKRLYAPGYCTKNLEKVTEKYNSHWGNSNGRSRFKIISLLK